MSTTKTKVLICPYCGDTQAAGERCRVCGGLFEPLSRQASHNAMGPWFVRDEKRPFQPGASYETIVKLIERGIVTKYTILRSPTTKQFWTVARRVPGIAHLLGYCHNCDATVSKDDHGCPSCGVPFGAYLDRNYLGLPEVKPLPWEAPVIDDGRTRAPAPMPAVDFRRAAEPLGLSAFASDAELRGMAARPAPAAYPSPEIAGPSETLAGDGHSNGAAHLSPGEPNTPQAYSPALPVSPVVEHRGGTLDSANSVAARALQRRLQRQQGTIRLLMAVVGIVTIGAIVVIIAMVARFARLQSNTTGNPTSTGSSSANPAVTGGGGAQPAAGAQSNAAPATTLPVTPPLAHEEPATSLPVDELATPAALQSELVKADHQHALELVVDARKENRPLKDRIKDAEQAAALLKSVKTRSSPADMPATIDQEIADADRLVERLKLQEFFP